MLQTYAVLLEEACVHADGDWRVSAFDSEAGYWGDGVSEGNEGIRTVSMLLACAALIKYNDGLGAAERRDFIDKSIAALRYATATHRTCSPTARMVKSPSRSAVSAS